MSSNVVGVGAGATMGADGGGTGARTEADVAISEPPIQADNAKVEMIQTKRSITRSLNPT